jgi:serine/threonine protein kinase/Tol biopolymer transport system component
VFLLESGNWVSAVNLAKSTKMTFSAGDRLGAYEIVSLIGAGGMGEVYKARDTRLERIVAIKVLPPHRADDSQFLDLFAREARIASALNHPNICALYDIGEYVPAMEAGRAPESANHYLVLEYLEGETLAARIAKGPLPVSEALKIAIEIVGALDKAHREGIIHRDLKTGNVMLTKTEAKLLDFGLAGFTKIGIVPTRGSGAAHSDATTVTMMAALTAKGTVFGTVHYMAPEQTDGEQADVRADLFSFGAVLYEMLTGRRALEDNRTSVTASLREVPRSASEALQPIPPALVRVIKACLATNREDRFHSAHDLWLTLRWIEDAALAVDVPASKPKSQPRWLVAALTLAAMAGIGFGIWRLRTESTISHTPIRFEYLLPGGMDFTGSSRHVLAISPDGARLAFVAGKQLYLHTLDEFEAQPIRGTSEDPMEPVFSPDGQWLAYFALARSGTIDKPEWLVRKVAVSGGAPITLGQLPAAPYGASWTNGAIVFAVNTPDTAAIQSVPESGGAVQTLLAADTKTEQLAQPQLLPDGKHIIFVSSPRGDIGGEGEIVVQSVGGHDRRILVSRGADPRVMPAGQLLYIQDGVLLAVQFDVSRLTRTGGAVPVVERVMKTPATSAGQFAVSSSGALAFEPAQAAPVVSQRELVWIDRQGRVQSIPLKPRAFANPRISPDGARIAVTSNDDGHDVWIYDIVKESLVRLTFGPGSEADPVWTTDNKHVLFSSVTAPGVGADMVIEATDGTGKTEQLTRHGAGDYPRAVSPDGKFLVFEGYAPNAGLWSMPLEPIGEPHALIADPKFGAYHGRVSPDGHWIAYDSDEAGRTEVFVRPFPDVELGRWQVSEDGGSFPFWARSGRELFFVTAANKLADVSVPAGNSFSYSKPQLLFDTSAYGQSGTRQFDISIDGRRFLAVRPLTSPPPARPSIAIVLHWLDDVKAKMTSKK